MNRLYLSVALAIICSHLAFAALDTSVCTGYPKMYNGKPCASTTRYWDSQKGACGCGSSDTNPFAWQWSKPTAAASAPIFGAGTWCGTGCGKCYKLTPTAVGASVVGRGAPEITSIVVKVTNLCPYAGNEEWCAYDVNSHGYEAHFDLMDYNMAGIISNMGWDNPEVVYEEVDCAANGYTDWNCECKDYATPITTPTQAPATQAPATQAPATQAPATQAPATQAPATEAPVTEAPTEAPTHKPTNRPRPSHEPSRAATSAPIEEPTEAATEAPVEEPIEASSEAPVEEPTEAPTEAPVEEPTEAPTEAPVEEPTEAPVEEPTEAPVDDETGSADDEVVVPVGDAITIQINGGSNAWWVGFSVVSDVSNIASVEIMDTDGALSSWTRMTFEGNDWWNMFSINPQGQQMKAPLSLRFTSTSGDVVVADNVITAFQAATVDTGVAL